MTDTLLFIGDLILLYGAAATAVFAISYASFFNWRKTDAGRALMYFVIALLVVFMNNFVARFFGADYPFREWVRIAVYIAAAWTITRLVVVLWRNWAADKDPLDLEPKPRKGEYR